MPFYILLLSWVGETISPGFLYLLYSQDWLQALWGSEKWKCGTLVKKQEFRDGDWKFKSSTGPSEHGAPVWLLRSCAHEAGLVYTFMWWSIHCLAWLSLSCFLRVYLKTPSLRTGSFPVESDFSSYPGSELRLTLMMNQKFLFLLCQKQLGVTTTKELFWLNMGIEISFYKCFF